MTKKLMLTLAMVTLLPMATATRVYAEDPPAADSGGAPAPDDPNAQPDPPDGVIDPNATYPTDGGVGTDQGETGEPPVEGAPSDVVPPDAAPDGAPQDGVSPDGAPQDGAGQPPN